MSGGLKKLLAEQRRAEGKLRGEASRVASSHIQVDVESQGVSVENETFTGSCQRTSPYDVPNKARGSISKSKSSGLVDGSKEEKDKGKERRSKSESHGRKRKHGHRVEVSQKKVKIFDPRVSGETNGKEIKIEEEESWFFGSKPTQVFSGFHLLNDAGEYVARSKEDVIDRAYQHLGQFTSDFVHLVSGFDVDERKRAAEAENRLTDVRSLFEKKCKELEDLREALDKKDEELTESLNVKNSIEVSLSSLRQDMSVLELTKEEAFQVRDEALKSRDEIKGKLIDVSGTLDEVKADLEIVSSTLASTQQRLEAEQLEKNKLLEQIVDLKKTSLLAGEEGYNDCWARFVKDGCDGAAHTWSKYLEELERDEDGEEEPEKSHEGGDENV